MRTGWVEIGRQEEVGQVAGTRGPQGVHLGSLGARRAVLAVAPDPQTHCVEGTDLCGLGSH